MKQRVKHNNTHQRLKGQWKVSWLLWGVRLGTGSHCHEYAKTGVDTGCEVYVGLGANQSGFQDLYATKFVHRVLDPKIAGGVKKSERVEARHSNTSCPTVYARDNSGTG